VGAVTDSQSDGIARRNADDVRRDKDMTRRFVWVICAVAAIAVVTGCAKKGLAGKWTGNTTMAGMAMNISLSFGADGKFQQDSTVTGGPVPATMVANGTWTTKESTLTMKPTSVTVNGIRTAVPANATKDFGYKLDGDSLTLTEGTAPAITLKRTIE
jgi:hypothetical protein